MKKLLIIFLSVLILAPATSFAGNAPTSTEKTELSYKPGKGKVKKMKNLKKAAKRNSKRSGGDMTKFNCGG